MFNKINKIELNDESALFLSFPYQEIPIDELQFWIKNITKILPNKKVIVLPDVVTLKNTDKNELQRWIKIAEEQLLKLDKDTIRGRRLTNSQSLFHGNVESPIISQDALDKVLDPYINKDHRYMK